MCSKINVVAILSQNLKCAVNYRALECNFCNSPGWKLDFKKWRKKEKHKIPLKIYLLRAFDEVKITACLVTKKYKTEKK